MAAQHAEAVVDAHRIDPSWASAFQRGFSERYFFRYRWFRPNPGPAQDGEWAIDGA